MTQSQNTKHYTIMIVGGGTAGWMAATLMAKKWADYPVKIQLLESAEIGTIGVGEGTTPSIKRFFDALEIDETQWMKACNATYKSGIRFSNWSCQTGCDSYFHPFFSQLDQYFEAEFVHNSIARRKGYDVHSHPDQFFTMAEIAAQNKAPLVPKNYPFGMHYAYHFDAGLLAQFLKDKAQSWGVEHLIGTVDQVHKTSDGDIDSIQIQSGTKFHADLFLDCSGFQSLLLGKTLNVPYISFDDTLLNDAAVTIATPITETVPSITTSTALKCGWAWKIPLRNRYGNGYVYSSKFIDKHQAEKELREHLGLDEHQGKASHLKMQIGRYSKGWEKNCLALGLSQGFIEPLEATALHFVSQSLFDFVEIFQLGKMNANTQQQYNAKLAARYNGIKDYIALHYLSNSRTDTAYWQAARDIPVSKTLVPVIEAWSTGKDFTDIVNQHNTAYLFSPLSWYTLLTGVGQFPPVIHPESSLPEQSTVDMEKIRHFTQTSASYFPSHKSALENIQQS